MKSALAIATMAIICAAGRPNARTVDMPLAPAQHTGNAWNGSWQGTTVSGHELVLQLQVQGQRITGRLTVGKQSANIIEGKIAGDAFTITTGPIDGHKVDATGRQVGDAIQLTIKGVKEPLTLTRMQ